MLIEEELSYKLRGLFFEISKEFGCLFKERAYHKIICQRLISENIGYLEFPKIEILDPFSGKVIDYYKPDLLIENKIIIEIKAVNLLESRHINQLITYLCHSKYELGFIVNFGSPRTQVIRRIYTNDKKLFLLK